MRRAFRAHPHTWKVVGPVLKGRWDSRARTVQPWSRCRAKLYRALAAITRAQGNALAVFGNGRLFLVDGKTPLQAALVLCEECQKVAKYAALLITPEPPATLVHKFLSKFATDHSAFMPGRAAACPRLSQPTRVLKHASHHTAHCCPP